jgi:hypothetical protein
MGDVRVGDFATDGRLSARNANAQDTASAQAANTIAAITPGWELNACEGQSVAAACT